MPESIFASDWKITDAPKKIAALQPMMPTKHNLFKLGAANMIWYLDPLQRCIDRCQINVSLLFPSRILQESVVGVVGFKFKSTND